MKTTVVGFMDQIYVMDLQTLKNETPAEGIVGLLNCTRFCAKKKKINIMGKKNDFFETSLEL